MKKILLTFTLLLLLISCGGMSFEDFSTKFKEQTPELVSYYSQDEENIITDMSHIGNIQYTSDGKGNIKNFVRLIDSEGARQMGGPIFIDAKYDVYYIGEKMKEVDGSTYEYIGKNFYKDDKNVYYKDKKIEGANPKEIELIGFGYSKDNKNIYYLNEVIQEADVDSFQPYDYGYSIDNKNVYYKTKEIEKISPKKFIKYYSQLEVETLDKKEIVINGDYKKTKEGIKYKDKVIQEVDVSTFHIIEIYEDSRYAVDKNAVYFEGIKLDEVDSKSFKVIFNDLTADKDNVYIKNIKDPKIDRATFEIIGLRMFKTKDGVYEDNKKNSNMDSKTFKVLKYGYSKDKNNVYCYGKIMEGADSSTFEVLEYGYSKDKNNVYYLNNVLKDATSSNFEVLTKGFTRDDKTLYKYGLVASYLPETEIQNGLNGKPKGNIDPKTVEIMDGRYVKDKNGVYYYIPISGYADIYGVFVQGSANKDKAQVINNSEFAKDNESIYMWGIRTIFDYDSFKLIDNDIVQDKTGTRIFWGRKNEAIQNFDESKKDEYKAERYKQLYER